MVLIYISDIMCEHYQTETKSRIEKKFLIRDEEEK